MRGNRFELHVPVAAAADVAPKNTAEPALDLLAVGAGGEVHRLVQQHETGAAFQEFRQRSPALGRGEGLLAAAIAEIDDALRAFEHTLIFRPIAHHHGPDTGLLFQPVHQQRAAGEIFVRHRLATGPAREQHDLGHARLRGIDLQRHTRLIVRGSSEGVEAQGQQPEEQGGEFHRVKSTLTRRRGIRAGAIQFFDHHLPPPRVASGFVPQPPTSAAPPITAPPCAEVPHTVAGTT